MIGNNGVLMNFSTGKRNRVVVVVVVFVLVGGLVLNKLIIIGEIEELVDKEIIGGGKILVIKTAIIAKTELWAQLKNLESSINTFHGPISR